MTVFRDLEPCSYVRAYVGVRMLAVGWLGRGYRPTGARRSDVADVLRRIDEQWRPRNPYPYYCGFHTCELCHRATGIGEIFIPGDGDVVFVAPRMIVHYLDEHDYAPPDAFCDAVLRHAPRDFDDHLAKVTAVLGAPAPDAHDQTVERRDPPPRGFLARLWRKLRGSSSA